MAEAALAKDIELNTTQVQEVQSDQDEHDAPEKRALEKKNEKKEPPDHFILTTSNINTLTQRQKCCTDDVANRTARYLFITIVPVLGILICLGKSDLNQILGISILFMYLFYFATLSYYFCSAKRGKSSYLFRVYTAARRVNLPAVNGGEIGWAKLNVACHQQLYPLKPIHSISEFSAIDGAVPSVMLANLGQYTWAIVTLHFMMNIKFRAKYGWGFADTFTIIGASGLVMLGVFEADPFNHWMQKIHMFGAVCGFGTLIGFLVQQSSYDDEYDAGNIIASFLVFFFLVFYLLWQFNLKYCEKRDQQKFKPLSGCEKFGLWLAPCKCCKKIKKEPMIKLEDITDEQKKEITNLSLLNVIFEAVVLLTGATALSLFIFYYNVVQNSYDYGDEYDNPYYQDNGFYGENYDYSYYSPAPSYAGNNNAYSPTAGGVSLTTSFH